ncbi:MAG TPA: Cof-type HAD-IIB family hydrolase, partial [Candidatus Izemoplasmatales bacterium]|nr:Cof-type HAD-IIB family hydrolase [Candidatus Izemoplasmatales bacterium]
MALIFFDLDGTILIDGQLVAGTQSLMKQLREQGHEVAIATGRNPNLLKDIDKKLEMNHMVLANGGYVISDHKVIYENFVPFNVVKRMMEKADDFPFDLTIEYFDEYVAYRQDTDQSLNFSKHFDLPIANYDDHVYPDRQVFAFVVFEDEVVKNIENDFPELQFNKSGGIAYDVNPSGDLKASGVKELIKYLGYEISDVYAFGDNFNDVKMFKAVGHGIAMGNAV